MVSRAADATQTSLLKSAVTRVKRWPAAQRWAAAGGAAALVLLLAFILWPSGKPARTVAEEPVKPAERPKDSPTDNRPSEKTTKTASAPAPKPTTTGRRQLFTTDLAGWKGLDGYWSVKDGVLTGSSRGKPLSANTFLYSEEQFGDFELSYQIRLAGAEPNSGVQIRSQVTNFERAIVKGAQVDAGGEYWGCLYDEGGSGMMRQASPGAMSVVRQNDFNDVVVRCRGRHVTINLNGRITVDADFPSVLQFPDTGVIAFQIHSGPEMEVQFRNVFLLELSPADKSPAPSAAAGDDWISLLGSDIPDSWTQVDGRPAAWKFEKGVLETVPGTGSIRTVQEFGPDYELHAEFWLPLMASQKGQARANSGIYLSGRHEIQILDNFNNDVPANTGSGAMYGVLAPSPEGVLPPETWQTFDITYRSPRWTSDGSLAEPGRLTLVRNGAKVIDDQPFEIPFSGGALLQSPGTRGPIILQDHKAQVRFRNLKVRPLAAAPASTPAWTSIFTGRDLAAWNPQGLNGWSVSDGVLVGQAQRGGPVGWLMSEMEFGDYELEFEYKIAPGSNSGIFLRAWPEGNVSGGEFVEVQLLDDAAPDFAKVSPNCRTGAVFKYAAPQPTPNAPAGQWNKMLLSVRGKHVQVTVNGVQVVDADIPALDRQTGHIGLQLYPTRIEFRNIRIREL
jgi:hypothetical protein